MPRRSWKYCIILGQHFWFCPISYCLVFEYWCIAFIEQIGPNVSISANARIGAGVRLISCIILDDVEIKVCQIGHGWWVSIHFLSSLLIRFLSLQENAVVIHSIVGWKSSIGKWSRVQASLHFSFLSCVENFRTARLCQCLLCWKF